MFKKVNLQNNYKNILIKKISYFYENFKKKYQKIKLKQMKIFKII